MHPLTARRTLLWGVVLLASVLPLLLYGLLFGVSAGLLALIGQLALAFVVGLVRLPPRVLSRGLLALLALLLVGALVERGLSKYVWQTSDKAGLVNTLSRLHRDTVSTYGFRSWAAPEGERATFSFEVRLLAGKPGWDWFRSERGFHLEPRREAEGDFTRVHPPPDGKGYVMRTFDLGEPIGGRRFRVLLDLRDPNGPARSPEREREVAADPIESGKPVGGTRCRGISLQAWSEGGGGRCLPVTLDAEWQRYSLSWRVPEGVTSSVVRVVLSDFGRTFDVRRVKFYMGGRGLGPLLPQAAYAQVAWAERPEAQSGYPFIPTPEWQRHSLEVHKGMGHGDDRITASLYTAQGLTLETRGVALTGPSGVPAAPAPSSTRQTILFGDPNLAGHTLAALGLALLSVTRSLPVGLGGALLTFVGVALTGSRAAWLGVAVGLPWLLLLVPRRKRWLFTALGLGAFVGLVFWEAGAARLFSIREVTARTDIWGAAWRVVQGSPLRGLGEESFAAYWARLYGGEAVQHAHNFWLELAAAYGVFGLAAALLLTAGLAVLAWRWGGHRGLALVAAVLVMNVFDTTLLYGGVLFPLVLALGALRKEPARGERNITAGTLHQRSA